MTKQRSSASEPKTAPSFRFDHWSAWPADVNVDHLAGRAIPGSLVLLPFCDSVSLVAQRYHAGCKVLAANPLPLPLLAVEAALSTVDRQRLHEVFITFGDSLKQGRPLQRVINQLYQTTCPRCGTETPARAFIWQRSLADPQEKLLDCSHCEFNGLAPVTAQDLHHLDTIETRGVHYHFLLGRTIGPHRAGTPAYTRLEQLHDLYTPRNLYAIAELIMKLEVVVSDPGLQRLCKAILLDCLLPASNLNGPSETGEPPHTLRLPARYLERNLWTLFEAAVDAWQPASLPTRITPRLQEFLEQRRNSVHFFPDQLTALRPYLAPESASLVLAPPPPANPARQALTTLWSGWLLGLKAAEPGHSTLTQKRIDWVAYQQPLMAALRSLRQSLKPEAPICFAFRADHRLQPPAVLLAALRTGFEVEAWEFEGPMQQIILRPEPPHYPRPLDTRALQIAVGGEINETIRLYLAHHARSTSENALHWAVWQSLLYSGHLVLCLVSLPEKQVLPWLNQHIRRISAQFKGETG